MTNQENEPAKSTKNSFWAQTDEWFGRRHRIWYFISGFGIVFVAIWVVFSQIIAPINQEVFISEVMKYQDETKEINKINLLLKQEKLALQDSLLRATTLGIDYGNYTLVRYQDPIELLANRLRLYYSADNSLEITIDTLGQVGQHSEHARYIYEEPCKNCIISLDYGSFNFSLYCNDLKVDTVVLTVYRAPK